MFGAQSSLRKEQVTDVLNTSDMVVQTPIYMSHPVEGDSTEVNARLKAMFSCLMVCFMLLSCCHFMCYI